VRGSAAGAIDGTAEADASLAAYRDIVGELDIAVDRKLAAQAGQEAAGTVVDQGTTRRCIVDDDGVAAARFAEIDKDRIENAGGQIGRQAAVEGYAVRARPARDRREG